MKPILLSPETIQNRLSLTSPAIDFYYTESIDSTNLFLKTLTPPPSSIAVCLTEMQHNGRGRFGRSWHSPYAENIYCSIRLGLTLSHMDLSSLSLVISLSIIETLQACHISTEDIYIKWPNDILWKQRKFCGILIELIEVVENHADIIIGIGINVNSNDSLNTAWCSLTQISQTHYDRNPIVSQLIEHVLSHVHTFSQTGLAHFMQRWQQFDYLLDREINIWQHDQLFQGRAIGINSQGQLVVVNDTDKSMRFFSSGEASLREML